MIPLIQNVVLIFKDKMLEIDMTITQMWFALNVHASSGYITHLLNNVLLKRFGYRKVTLTGVTFVVFGLSMSSWIHNYLGFMLTFGLVTAIGVGLNTSSYGLAIKSYFTSNQNKAIALSMTLTALGPILMPQIINWLIHHYDPDGVILILAGIIAHGYIGAVLLQPVKKHMIKISLENANGEAEKNNSSEEERLENEDVGELVSPPVYTMKQYPLMPPRDFITNRRFPGFRRKDSVISINYEQEHAAIMGLDSTLGGSLYSLEHGQRRNSSITNQMKYLTKTTWWKSEESINLESCYDIFEVNSNQSNEENYENDKTSDKSRSKKTNGVALDETFHLEEHMIHFDFDINSLPWYKRWFYRAVEMFGFDIFLDLRYVNIMIGMSLVILVEMNFTVLLPFLLFEYTMDISEVAAYLSVLGAADIFFRFLAPHIGDCLKQPARIMIMLVLLVIIAARTEERLPSVSAIQIVANSIMSLLGGYVIGIIRTSTGSYKYCVILLNCLTGLTIIMWSSDILFKKCRRKRAEAINIEMTEGTSQGAAIKEVVY
ncbi:hypothetical protein ABEB36_013512 [Hypothenemus hampei]|uniref:Uncharacterized protein n=1 Tax=Hypothenemus hampei TaxID=57062 RepID=A0ABD1E774_HYPHA